MCCDKPACLNRGTGPSYHHEYTHELVGFRGVLSRVNTPTPSGPHSTPSPRRVGNVHHTVKGYGLKFQVYVPPTLLRDKRPNHLK